MSACPTCHGCGDVTVAGRFPDGTLDYDVPCQHCNSTGQEPCPECWASPCECPETKEEKP